MYQVEWLRVNESCPYGLYAQECESLGKALNLYRLLLTTSEDLKYVTMARADADYYRLAWNLEGVSL